MTKHAYPPTQLRGARQDQHSSDVKTPTSDPAAQH